MRQRLYKPNGIFIPEGNYVRDHGYKQPEQVLRLSGAPRTDGEHTTVLHDDWDFQPGRCVIIDGKELLTAEIIEASHFLQEQLTQEERKLLGRWTDAHDPVTVIRWRLVHD